MRILHAFPVDFVISRASRRCGKSRNPALAEGHERRRRCGTARRVFRDFGKGDRSPEIDGKPGTDF
jgi:hypothetical protein